MINTEVAEIRRWCPNRRALLTGVGAVGLTGALAACGGGDDDRADGAGDDNAAAAGAGTVLAPTADVPVGGGVVAGGVLVVQPAAGTFKAYDAACPHQGVQVGAPQDGVSTCPAHNSTFAIADGSRLGGPAPRGLTEVPVTVDGANVVRT